MPSLKHLRHTLAADLLDIGAVTLSPDDPFTWSSGLEAPLYCDNRRTLAHPRVRRRIADGFVEVLKRADAPPTLIAGTATAGIPHATLLAARLALPMVYVRSEAKAHGAGRRIEGADVADHRVVLVEDLVSTGQSALRAARALEDAGAKVSSVLAIFSYQLDAAADAFADAPFSLHGLTDFSTLLNTAEEDDQLSDGQRRALQRWHDDPTGWEKGKGRTEERKKERMGERKNGRTEERESARLGN